MSDHQINPTNNKGSLHNFFINWATNPDRIPLLRWSIGFFTFSCAIVLVVALRYFAAFHFPLQPLGSIYTISAFISHFGSILLILWIAPVLLLLLIVPIKRFIIPLSVVTVAIVLALVLLDSQLYTTRRFHFNLLTIKLFGFTTWGFGVLYLCIAGVFLSFVAKLSWERFVLQKKKIYLTITLPVILGMLLFTHLTHIWADANGFVPVTRFTTVLPLFYPSTSKKKMMKMGWVDISQRRAGTSTVASSELLYPIKALEFAPPDSPINILLIAVDGMRSDVLNASNTPECWNYATTSGTIFTNHWSGGNSTKMGCFSLFYGLPPTYEQYVENNKQSPLFIDRLLESNYRMGIFTSYRLYTPATLDITAFVKIPNLRLETILPGQFSPCRNDSAITDDWKKWLDTLDTRRPFFGFLFYDALLKSNMPLTYNERVKYPENATPQQKEYAKYAVSMNYIDTLIGAVLHDLERRELLNTTAIIITADHGVEFNENNLGFSGHGSSFSKYQTQVPLLVFWPGKQPSIVNKRTSHYDIVPTLMKDALGCTNPESDYCSGKNLFSDHEWKWHIVGSYFNFAILEPNMVTVQFPGGYYERRDKNYELLPSTTRVSPYLADAFIEIGRFYRK